MKRYEWVIRDTPGSEGGTEGWAQRWANFWLAEGAGKGKGELRSFDGRSSATGSSAIQRVPRHDVGPVWRGG